MAAKFLYVGSTTAGQAKTTDSPAYGKVKVEVERRGVAVYQVGADGHSLTRVGTSEFDFHVGWLAAHPSNGHLYGVGGGSARAFAVNADGTLRLVSSSDTMGNGCFLELTKDGRWALVANYMGGNASVLPIKEDGSLGEATDSKHHHAELNPALADRQETCHPHQVRLDPQTNKWALICDLGADCVWIYALDSVRGSLVGAANSSRHLRLPEGSGPRHLDFHPNGRWVYVLCELSGNIVACDWNAEEGRLNVKQSLYALPEGVACCRAHHSGNSHVLVAPDGRTVYATTRTDNQLAVFRIDEETGELTKVQHVSTRGVCPRNFQLDWSCTEPPAKQPHTDAEGGSGRWPRLRVGNQDSQNLVEFKINPETGLLEDSPLVLELDGLCPAIILGPVSPPNSAA